MEEIEILMNEVEYSINKWYFKKKLMDAILLYGKDQYLEGYKKASEDALESIKNYNTEDDV